MLILSSEMFVEMTHQMQNKAHVTHASLEQRAQVNLFQLCRREQVFLQ